MLSKDQTLFLSILKNALTEEYGPRDVSGRRELSEDDLYGVLRLARIHHIMPMILQSIYKSDDLGIDKTDSQYKEALSVAIRDVASQTVYTAEFLNLYHFLSSKGLQPVVVKGIIIRRLYPHENFRISADEDLWIDAGEMAQYHNALLEYGLFPADPQTDLKTAPETAYQDPDTLFYIELHTKPFPPESDAYGNLNKYFIHFDCKYETCGKLPVLSLAETEHLLYLFLHAFKHFLYSGFGIRQVCDIILYASHFADVIDWKSLTEALKDAHAYQFAVAICKIGESYLLPDFDFKAYFSQYAEGLSDWCDVDEEPLLKDILNGGLYGSASMIRLHSSNMTLQVVKSQAKGTTMPANRREGMKIKASEKDLSETSLVIHSVFLPLKSMRGRYPYLRKAPFLLPIAWIQRIFHYLLEIRKNHKAESGNSSRERLHKQATESIRMGKNRINLLKQYHIID